MTYIPRMYRVTKHHDIIVKRVAKKLKISESEVIRKRITSFEEMVEALKIDMENTKFINVKNKKEYA